MKNLQKSKSFLLGLGLIALCSMAGVLAYFSESTIISNPFSTSTAKIAIEEVFDPSDFWLPGEQKQKEVRISNTGDTQMLMRFKVESSLLNAADEVLPIPSKTVTVDGNEKSVPLFTIGWNSNYLNQNFQKEENEDGTVWYYYKHIFAKDLKTDPVINYVEFADWAGNQYQDYQANVKIVAEMIQYMEDNTDALSENNWPAYTKNENNIDWNLNSN